MCTHTHTFSETEHKLEQSKYKTNVYSPVSMKLITQKGGTIFGIIFHQRSPILEVRDGDDDHQVESDGKQSDGGQYNITV